MMIKRKKVKDIINCHQMQFDDVVFSCVRILLEILERIEKICFSVGLVFGVENFSVQF